MHRLVLGVLCLLAFGLVFPVGWTTAAPAPVTVRVALYPYVPGQYAVFMLLAREFQKRNEGVTLELIEVDPMKDYYEDGLTSLSADVYEIDSILLNEMKPKLMPLTLPLDAFTKEAKDAVTRDGQVFAVPHWLCGNFLFYRRGDQDVEKAATWSELVKGLSQRGKPLVFDFYGRLTLGEWYFTLLAERMGVDAAQAAILASDQPNPEVVSDLKQILSACPSGYCRSDGFHRKTGFYARAFVRGEAVAYVGYSESLHYGLQEILDNCGLGSSCLAAGEIAVRRLPSIAATAAGVGWVDGLAISKDASGAVKDAAIKFVQFATSPEGYQAVLQRLYGEAPRYLLPARTDVKPTDAPLHPDLLAAHAGRVTGTKPGLNAALRALSKNLNCLLPIDRTDTGTLGKCKIP